MRIIRKTRENNDSDDVVWDELVVPQRNNYVASEIKIDGCGVLLLDVHVKSENVMNIVLARVQTEEVPVENEWRVIIEMRVDWLKEKNDTVHTQSES